MPKANAPELPVQPQRSGSPPLTGIALLLMSPFAALAFALIIILQIVIIYLLLTAPQMQAGGSDIFTVLVGRNATGTGGGSVQSPACSITEAGGRTVIVTNPSGGATGGEGSRTIVLLNNNTETVIMLNGSGEQGQPGSPGSEQGSFDENGCYTVTVCPGGNGTPVCPTPDDGGDSCQPNGMWCGNHPNAPPNSTCCSGLSCQSGYCMPPPPETTPACVPRGMWCGDHPSAPPNSTCCSGLTCQFGYCMPPPTPVCSTSGPCTTTADCCGNLACVNGMCGLPQSCKSQSGLCQSSTECCSTYSCLGGTCQPTPQQPACTDSDNGVNLNVLGTAVGTYNGVYGNYTDFCRPTGEQPPYHVYNQVEYSCTGNGSQVTGTAIGCGYGCANGVCLPQPDKCTDTDGGSNPDVAGTTIGTNSEGVSANFTDSCLSGTAVNEYSCSPNRVAFNTSIACAYGCSNGACSPQAQPSCSDSDGGMNFNVSGTVTTSVGGSYSDSCSGSTQVIEYYCSGSDAASTFSSCPYGCTSGQCMPQPPQLPQSCADSDGGVNYLVKGTLTTGDGLNVTDYCESGTSLREYRCFAANSSTFTSESVVCVNVGPSICNNGACGG